MNTKKLNIVFIVLAVFAVLAGLVHTMWVYLGWVFADNYNSSAPAEIAFLFIIPYLLVSAAVLVAWQLYKRIAALQSEGDLKKINLYFTIPLIAVLFAGLINTLYFFIDFVFNLNTQSIVEPQFYLFIFIPYAVICISLLAIWLAVIIKKIKQVT